MAHDIGVAFVASSKEEALNLCQDNSDFCGDSYSWHWALCRMTLDSSGDRALPEHYTIDLVPCDTTGEEKSDKDDSDDKMSRVEELLDELKEAVREIVNERRS